MKIVGFLKVGDTRVCGTAPPNSPVNIHDVTTQPNDVIINHGGTSDGIGNFCITVIPPLFKGQVIMAEANGTFSQPYVVGVYFQTYLPGVSRS